MAETLHFALPDATLHAAFNYLDLELAKRAQAELDPDQTGDPFRLNVANALWGQDGYHFESTFLDLLAVNYGAGLRLVDYERAPEPARQTINAWVSDQTEQKIPELIPEGLVDSSTRLVLTNAIYFNASWDLPFDEELTHPGTFHADVGDVTVDMMVEQDNYRYAAGDGYQTIALPYVGDELDMVLVVPEAGKFAEVEGSLADGALDSMLAELQAAEVQLTVPKWSFRSEVLLKDQLSALGMAEAFSTSADFSGMTGTRALCIADVVHEAFVDVDEEGTEAAAATAVIMWETSVPEPIEPIELTVDRPFLFLIRDLPTETVLFLGRVTDPS